MRIEKSKKVCLMKHGREIKYPFNQCRDVGDSFFIPNTSYAQISGSLNYWNKKLYPFNFNVSTADEKGNRLIEHGVHGIRVVRVR